MGNESEPRRALDEQLYALLRELERWLEIPIIVLAFVWLVLMVAEFIWGLTPWFSAAITIIWIIFIIDFLLRLTVAPRKSAYLRRNWLTALSLALPALRLFRAFQALRLMRAAQTARGLRLVRVVASMNRGMRALRASMARRGAGYVFLLTLIVAFAGAAGMYAFERGVPAEEGFESFGEALWWTVMLLTTIGSEYWPQTVEGRILCTLLSIYSLGILGYITATLATFFVGRDAEDEGAEVAGARTIRALHDEMRALRTALDVASRPGDA